MIDKKSRRVVIINNIQSETIDQAIFILKNQKKNPKILSDAAAEAQAIINNYINQVEVLKTSDNEKSRDMHISKKKLCIKPRLILLAVISAIAALCFIFRDALITAFVQH